MPQLVQVSWRRLCAAVLATLLGLAIIVAGRAAALRSRQLGVEAVEAVTVDAAAAERLAQALRFATVSHEEQGVAEEALAGLRAHLAESYPQTHAALLPAVIGGHSLLFTWAGADAALEPLLLAAHLDVVPAQPDAGAKWTHPPFGGEVAEGFVWGRGAMDDKQGVVGILEAVEALLREGYRPRRGVYLAFGQDEEIGGARGARAIAQGLRERGVRLQFVLDEGLPIAVDVVPGVARPVALVGVAEKGYVTVELTVESAGGHSSTPPRHSAIGVLAAALRQLEEQPFPARYGLMAARTFGYLAPEMGFAQRMVFANTWLFAPLIERMLSAGAGTDALQRTSTAVTVIEGGVKDNVLPNRARALVNFRTLPGVEPQEVLAHVRRVVNDERVHAAFYAESYGTRAPPAGPATPSFALIQRTLHEVFPEAVVAPGLMLGATDARHYADLAGDVFRFTPLPMRNEDIARLHGIDERVAVADFGRSVHFYYRLLRNATQ